MAWVEERIQNGATVAVARWRTPEGKQRSKTFPGKGKQRVAMAFATAQETDVRRGDYIDPRAGKVTFAAYAEQWLAGRSVAASTRQQMALRLRVHVLPTLGRYRLNQISSSMVSAWLNGLPLAASTKRTVLMHVRAVLQAAMDDDLIRKNPARAASVRTPTADRRKVDVWSTEQVSAVRDALPDRYSPLVMLGAGLGLRQGEILGLSVDDIDFLRGMVTIRRQVTILDSRSVLCLPKYRRIRAIPLPPGVRDGLAAHLTAFPAQSVTLPWETPDGPQRTVRLLLTSRERKPLNRNYVNTYLWKPALRAAGVEANRANGMHVLRHSYATAALAGGEDIRTVAAHLGHDDPAFTLRTYTHPHAGAGQRTAAAADALLGLSGKRSTRIRVTDVS